MPACLAVGMIIGTIFAAIRCALDYVGWWPMDYTRHRNR